MKPSESLHRPDMKDVGFEEPRAETLFDEKRDITARDIEKCRQALETHRQAEDWWVVVEVANGIKEIDPAFHLLTEITAADREAIQEHLAMLLRANNSQNFIQLYLRVKSLDPHFTIDSLNTPGNRSMICKQYRTHHTLLDWARCVEYALAFRQLQWAELPAINFTPREHADMRVVLREMRQNKEWLSFVDFANIIHKLDPDLDLRAELTDDDIRNIREKLSMLRQQRSWGDFAVMAGAMNRLARTMEAYPSDSSISGTLPETRTF